jgi:zinc protease
MRRSLASLLLFLAAAPAYAAPPIAHWTSASGSRVYFVEERALAVLDVSVEFPAGSAYDGAGGEGTARLAHALLKEGSERSSAAELGNRLAAVGALLSPVFDRDRAGYRLRTLSSERERSLATEVFTEILQRPAFAAEAFEREKARLLSATSQEESRPGTLLVRRLYAAMYGEHPYGRIHTEDSVKSLTREATAGFYHRHYTSPGAVITLVGDISAADARLLADRLSAGLPAGAVPAALPEAGPSRTQSAPLRIHHPSGQSHIALGVPAMSRSDPEYFAFYVGNYILGGGGFVSRLYKGVREERGLAYSVYSTLQAYGARGPLVVGLQTERTQAEGALATTRQILERFVSQGPTERELLSAKKGIAGGFALRTDSNLRILDEVAQLGFYRLPLDWLDGFVPNVQKVTAAQVRNAFAKRVDAAQVITVIVGASP